MSQSPREPESLAEGTLISHLLELRTRLLRAVVALSLGLASLAVPLIAAMAQYRGQPAVRDRRARAHVLFLAGRNPRV